MYYTASLLHKLYKQVKEYRKELDLPKIVKTPGTFDGAQYSFLDLLKEKVEKEVAS